MKFCLILFFILYASLVFPMSDEQKEKRKSCSPDRTRSQVITHHRKSSSISRMLATLHLRTDEAIASSDTVKALVTDRRSIEVPPQAKESPKRNRLIKSDSRNFVQRAIEINKENFAKTLALAFEEIKKIEATDDAHSLQCRQYISTARYFYMQSLSLELSTHLPWIESMADEEIKPVQEEFDKKMASLKEAQKK